MRRFTLASAVVVVLLAGCSSDGSDKPSASSVPSTTAGSTTTTRGPTATPSTTIPVTTTTVACPGVGTTEPIVTAKTDTSALLRAVAASVTRCGDRVTFDFTTDANAAPKCTIVYTAPPFTMDGSGARVAVSGSAFVRLRCEPAYGYDFESGATTYTGPKRITATGTKHVKELVETGDFEGVLSWVIGLDTKLPFSAVTTTLAGPQARTRLTIRFF